MEGEEEGEEGGEEAGVAEGLRPHSPACLPFLFGIEGFRLCVHYFFSWRWKSRDRWQSRSTGGHT